MGLAAAIVFSALIPGMAVFADDNVAETAIGDVTDPGILPDSGFYFMKSWGRNMQVMFAGSDTERARLMLRYTNEDALALEKMYEQDKYEVGAKHAEQYALQLQDTVQTMEQVRTRQGEAASEELVDKLEHNYLRQQELLLSVLEKAPDAAQNGILNAIENSNKHVGAMVMAQQGQAELQQYQQQVNQQTNNMGEEIKIKVRQRLQVMHGQAEQSAGGDSGQGVMTQQTTETQTQTQAQTQTQTQAQNQGQGQNQTQTQTQQQTQTQTQTSTQTTQQTGQQSGQQSTQNQGTGQSNTNSGSNSQGSGNKKQGK
jgi:hypothetical protein